MTQLAAWQGGRPQGEAVFSYSIDEPAGAGNRSGRSGECARRPSGVACGLRIRSGQGGQLGCSSGEAGRPEAARRRLAHRHRAPAATRPVGEGHRLDRRAADGRGHRADAVSLRVAGVLADRGGDRSAGAVGTVFVFVYMLVSPVSGYLGDRMQRRYLVNQEKALRDFRITYEFTVDAMVEELWGGTHSALAASSSFAA